MTDLIHTGEVAELLGVTPDRVRALKRDRPDFPQPALTGSTGQRTYWRRSDIEHWNATADRSPGRRAVVPPTT